MFKPIRRPAVRYLPNGLGIMREGVHRDGLIDLCKYIGKHDTMVEIGSYAGESALIFSNYFKKIYCVDPWKKIINGSNVLEAEKKFNKLFKNSDIVVKKKMYSKDAVKEFEDFSLDFVYIDAGHTYTEVKNDILLWFPKIKLNGYMGGHDLSPVLPGIKRALDEIFGEKYKSKVFRDSSLLIEKE